MKWLATILVISTTAAVPVHGEVELNSPSFAPDLDGLDAFDCDGQIRWVQDPDGASGLAAQDDVCYPFLAQTADNFVGTGYDIIGAGWYGVYWNGSPLPPDRFRIEIYDCSTSCIGALLYSATTTDYNETLGAPNGYCSNIPAFSTTDGMCYGISMTAEFCFPPQYGAATGVGDGSEACFRSAFFGFSSWTPASDVFGLPYELAFLLYYDEPTPTTATSWSTIKRMYQ